MAKRSKTPCNKPGCPELIESGQGYCDKHKKQSYRQQKNQERNTEEGKKANRFYASTAWRKTRRMQLNSQPLCEVCKKNGIVKEAEEVHHIDGNRYNNSFDNLESLCKACHSAKPVQQRV